MRSLCSDGRFGQEVAVEALIIERAIDPHVTRPQTVAQGSADRGFVTAAVYFAVDKHQLLPFFVRKGHRRVARKLASPLCVQFPQEPDSDQKGIARTDGLEGERIEEGRRIFAQRIEFLAGGDELILVGERGERANFRSGLHQGPPADRLIQRLEQIGVPVTGIVERVERLIEKAHQAADILRRRLIAAFLALAGEREHRADELVIHLDGGIRQFHFELKHLGNQCRAPPAQPIVAQQEGWRDRAFPRELAKAMLVDGLGKGGIEAQFAHGRETVENAVEVGWTG